MTVKESSQKMAGSEELHANVSTHAAPRSLVSDPRTTCRVSSVLDRNKKLYGADNMLTTDVTTCWNSAQGSPQQILLQFQRSVDVETLDIMFQGGFVGQDVQVHVKNVSTEQWEQLTDLDVDPDDANEMQVFPCKVAQINALRITFSRSTDFYGRVIIYRLDVTGHEHE